MVRAVQCLFLVFGIALVQACSSVTSSSTGSSDGLGDSGLEAAGFNHDGRRYELSCGVINPDLVEPSPFATGTGGSSPGRPLHQVRGVDPAVLLASPNLDGCDLMPNQAWQSAFAASEERDGQPSAAYNEAWCTASLYGPDPAEGFSC